MSQSQGLEGVVATASSVSSIIDGVLSYQGYMIDDLADNASFEEVIFLLWNGYLPNKLELEKLEQELAFYSQIPETIIEQIKKLPIESVHPMSILRSAVSNLGILDSEADDLSDEANQRKALKLQAQLPTIVTAFSRIREGKEPLAPRSDLSFAANFLYMLTGEEPSEIAVKAFNKALVLHADHELNASTFTARVCVATLSDMYSGVTAAIGALKGPLHGGANERVMSMLMEVGSEDNVTTYIREALDKKVKIMGFGHRVYKNGDPRAKHLKEMSKQLGEMTGETKWYNMSVQINEMVTKEKGLLPNVDFYSASVYHCLGIKHDLFTPIFAISRVSGWTAHILEQYKNNRLIRPRAEYIGPETQVYIPIEQR